MAPRSPALIAVLALAACDRRASESAAPTASASERSSAPVVASESAAAPPPSSASALASGAPPPPSATPAASADRLPAPPLDDIGAVVLWTKDANAKGGFRSEWVEPGGKQLSRGGIFAVSSHTSFTLASERVLGCPQPKRDREGGIVARGNAAVVERPMLDMPVFVGADGRRVAPWKDGHGYPIFGTSCPDTLQDYAPRVVVEGGLGAIVTATLRAYEDHGGAHGVRQARPFAIDLDAGAAVPLAPPPQDLPALQRAAGKLLGAEAKDVTFASATPMVGPSGRALVLYKLWASSSYAGGTGDSSYSNDVEVSSKSLPRELLGFEQLPRWAASALKGATKPAFVVPKARVDAVRAELERAYGEK